VGGRKSPFPITWPLAYTTVCTTVSTGASGGGAGARGGLSGGAVPLGNSPPPPTRIHKVILQETIRGGRTAWSGYSVVGMMCRHLMNCNIELCPDQCLVSVRFLHSAIVDCYFILCIFRYVRVIVYIFCCAGVLVCLFVVTVADLGLCH